MNHVILFGIGAILAYVWFRLYVTNTDLREQDYVPDGEDWNYRSDTQEVFYYRKR